MTASPETESPDPVALDEALPEVGTPAAAAEIEAPEAVETAEAPDVTEDAAPEPAVLETAAEPAADAEPEPAATDTPAPADSVAHIAEEPLVAAPVPAAETVEPAAAVAAAGTKVFEAAKAAPALAYRFTFAPTYLDIEGIGTILMNYMHNESVAALSHMRALGEVRTPADMIRLNVTEMQRAADASLTCWIALSRRAARPLTAH